MDCPHGFGLLQLNHDFKDYQDVIGWYDKRPSLWVEPIGKWGKGATHLMEIPTTGETLDNIVCFWQPSKPVKAGSEFNFQYKNSTGASCRRYAAIWRAWMHLYRHRRLPGRLGSGRTLPGPVVPSFCD